MEGFQSPELFWLTTHFRMCFSRVLATLNGIPQNLSTALLDLNFNLKRMPLKVYVMVLRWLVTENKLLT